MANLIKKIRQYFFRKRLEKHLTTSTRAKRYVDYNSAKTILLIFESDYTEKNKYIREIIEQMTKDGKKVFAWGFLNKKMTSTAILPNFKILDQQTIDWLGCPKASFINELRENEYDLLIDLNRNDELTLRYVALHANAAFKTGMSCNSIGLFDFEIKLPEDDNKEKTDESTKEKENYHNINDLLFHIDQQILFELLIFYLKRIETKD